MPITNITLPLEALVAALQEATAPLFYPSESDGPLEIYTFPAGKVGETFTSDHFRRLVYSKNDRSMVSTEWEEMHHGDSKGTRRFFRYLLDVITITPDNQYTVAERYDAEHAPKWRKLRDLLFDNTIDRKWFRIELAEPYTARKDIYAVGRHLQATVNDETIETTLIPGDWVVVATHVIET
jgi:hypothetical protein